jgi:hypothetical protein
MTATRDGEKIKGARGWFSAGLGLGRFYREFGPLRLTVIRHAYDDVARDHYVGWFGHGIDVEFTITRAELEAAGVQWYDPDRLTDVVALNDIGNRAKKAIRGWASGKGGK